MKNNILYFVAVLCLIGTYSCDKDDDSPSIVVKSESITMGAGYVNDVYYSLNNGVITEVSRLNWDIAFSVDAMSSSIIINDGAGVVLKEYPTTDGWNWTDPIDTIGYSEWNMLYNSDETWEDGAFGQNASGHPNYGWGEYNMTTHNVEGVAMYIVELPNDEFKRIFIEIKDATEKKYIFKYSDVNGANEISETISFADLTSNYLYYSLQSETVVADREPDASTWDLLFTNYADNTINYLVTGVKHNIGVVAIDQDNTTDLTLNTYLESAFNENITTIGYDWKEFDMGTYLYSIDPDRVYFAKDGNDNVYKIVFTGYEGSSTGNINFDITGL